MEEGEVKSRLVRWIAEYFERKARREIFNVVYLAFQAKPAGLELILLITGISIGGVFFSPEEGKWLWLGLTAFCLLAVLSSLVKMVAKGFVEYQARLTLIKRGDTPLKEAQKIVKDLPSLEEDDLWLLTRVLNLASAGFTYSSEFQAEIRTAMESPRLKGLKQLFDEVLADNQVVK